MSNKYITYVGGIKQNPWENNIHVTNAYKTFMDYLRQAETVEEVLTLFNKHARKITEKDTTRYTQLPADYILPQETVPVAVLKGGTVLTRRIEEEITNPTTKSLRINPPVKQGPFDRKVNEFYVTQRCPASTYIKKLTQKEVFEHIYLGTIATGDIRHSSRIKFK